MSSKAAWKTNHNAKLNHSISYAERLRRANQRPPHKSDTPTIESRSPPEIDKVVNSTRPTTFSSTPMKSTTSFSPPFEDKTDVPLNTPNQSSPSGSQQGSVNVWEERMRQRKFKQSGSSVQSGTQMDAGSNIFVTSPNQRKPDIPSCTNSRDASLDTDPSLDGIPNNNWLQQIYMLNGDEHQVQIARRVMSKSDTNRLESTAGSENKNMGTTCQVPKINPLETEKTNQPWAFLPDDQTYNTVSPQHAVPMPLNQIVKPDGSYAPHRISDPPVATMTGIGPRLSSMNSAYAPKVSTSRIATRGNTSSRAQPNKGYDAFRYHQYSSSMPNSVTMLPYMFVPTVPFTQGIYSNPDEHRLSSNVSKAGSSIEDFSGKDDDGVEARSVGDKSVPYYNTGTPYITHLALSGNSPTPYMVPFQPFMQMPYPGIWPYHAGQPVTPPIPPSLDTSSLLRQLRGQVEFYFSDKNLASDLFLREQMDAEGFVPLRTILGFKRIHAILRYYQRHENSEVSTLQTAIQGSSFLFLDAEKMRVRRASNWQSFVLPKSSK